jgi:hypothetical protein
MDKGGDYAADSRIGLSLRTYAQSSNTKQKAQSTAEDEPKDFTPSRAAVIEQWMCFVLGVVCIACGAFGVFANHFEGPSSALVAWLGQAYIPVLRVTALLCLFMGLMLMRRGWSSPDRDPKRSDHERQP